ncbi:hypothetical protein ABKA04_003570 [Annulohypoxylon sp. FPYF3050]
MSTTTPLKPRPPPGQQGSTPFRSATASRFRSSLVPMNKPSTPTRVSRLTGKLAPTANPSYGRDLFRTNTPQTVRTTKFAPNLPADATKMTPSARKFTHKSTSGGMTGIASTELFKMRIPSPDPELSGEALSKEVPEDPHRKGTIYADQFLAHKCPKDFDDLQRRQFFCILDLRRLKYAANEIFAKKDWKLNIMNFAKEYEKSRGLIMLRYGLYEFKNVKPSEEVLKKWRATHNLPDPEPQAESTATAGSTQGNRRLTGTGGLSVKRKAEEDLTPKDNALMASTANQNKRRNLTEEHADPILTGPAPFKKSKRKVDDTEEPDENQPSKVQKPTPSAAKSKFESILNRSQSGTASPLKKAPLPSFGTPKPSEPQDSIFVNKSNPFASFSDYKRPSVEDTNEGSRAKSVLIGSTPVKGGSNIFSYLSESSANSSANENENADGGDTESESEEEGSQEAPPSDQPSTAASAGTSTPSTQNDSVSFAAGKPTANTFGLFGQSNKDIEANAGSKGGLFGRVQMGSNGQPLRATPNTEVFSSAKQPPTEAERTQTPTQRPGDFTFNAATTPISFSPATVSKPESNESNKTADASLSKPPVGALFGAGAPTSSAFQPSTASASLFNSASTPQTKTGSASTSLFSPQTSTPATSKLFGGVQKADEKDPAETSKTPSAPKEPSGLFGASSSSTTVPTPTSKSIFGSSTTNGGVGGQSIFANTPKSSGSNLFGGSSSETPSFGTNGAKVNGSSTTKSLFETPAKQPSANFTFGASKPETTSDTPKPSNGVSQVSSSFNTTTPKPVFSSEGLKPTTPATTSLFGNSSTTPATFFGAKNGEATPAEKKPAPAAMTSLFGSNSTTSTNLFGSKSANIAPAEKKNELPVTKPASSFESTSTAGPSFVFGSQSTAPTVSSSQTSTAPSIFFGAGANGTQANGGESKKPEVQFGSSTAGSNSMPFTFSQGGSGSDTGFTFTAGGNGQSFNNPFSSPTPTPSASFAEKPSTPAPASTFNFSFGQQAPSTPKPAPATPSFSFGASTNANATNGAPSFGGTSSFGGAPSFSFTTATPPQNNANSFSFKPATTGSMPTGSLLQTSNDARASKTSPSEQVLAEFTNPPPDSPFPAPSSIGTTPVSGTPEPQTQNEDGEEGPQEQISLTDGGPGEEDEIILHEVRAKAIKYVTISKDSEDEEEKKSPWATQGVGPLRVLKNKSTGTVRVLLRAEPRGHIAMNKALLPDIEYKSKEKTVTFAAVKDDGAGLETWLLQVKKPEFAQELVRVLEANKSANKN